MATEITPAIASAWATLQTEKPTLSKGQTRTPEFIVAVKAFGAKESEFCKTLPPALAKLKKKKLIKLLSAAALKQAEEDRQTQLSGPFGTRDFDPEALRLRNWLFSKFRRVGRLFGFEEYDAPVLEHQWLYKRKAGEEITEQMYCFTDKEGNEVTLRPEMTPTLARMVLQKQQYGSGIIKAIMPLKWFTIAQCWRFEACQRGRKREHYQWNMDIVGIDGVEAEIELLAAVATFFSSIGVGPDIVGLKVNSRKMLQSLINSYGISDDEQFTKVCVIVDKLDKIGDEAVLEELAKIGVSDETGKSLLRALQAKDIDDLIKRCGNRLKPEVVSEMQTLFRVAKDYTFEGQTYRLSDYLEFDASVVRGLAYYTGVVFECFDRQGWKLRAICGGGRYDKLMQVYGSKTKVPCCGFGFGDCVIIELLKEMKKMPKTPRVVDYVVAMYSKDLFGAANQVASALRAGGKTVNLVLEKKDAKKAFAFADKVGAIRCAFVAPDEFVSGKVRIKDLRTAKDESDMGVDVPIADLANVDSYFGGPATSTPAAVSNPAPTKNTGLTKSKCGRFSRPI